MDHLKAREKVCIVCYHKASRHLSNAEVEAVQNIIMENYNVANPDLPCGICNSCHEILNEHSHGNMKRSLPISDNYHPGTRILTRGQPNCPCRICEVAKSNGLAVKKKKRGRPSLARPPIRKFKLCPSCFSQVYKGSCHSEAKCQSQKHRLENISHNILLNDKTKEQVASRILTELKADGCKQIELATLGRPQKVSTDAAKPNSSENASQLSVDDILSMRNSANLTDRQLFSILRDIRLRFGRKSVESNVRCILVERKTIFSDLFSTEIINFRDSKGNILERPFVFCHDSQEFIDRICLLRGNSPYCTEDKIGFDDGKGVLKLTLSIYDPDGKLPKDTATYSRVTRSQGISGSDKFVDTGVNKIFILAAAPKTPETYENCKIFIDKTCINNIKFHLAADLKLTNICLGIMSHASLHPCPYCEGTKNIFEEDAAVRTLETISENHHQWKNESGKKGTLKEYYNCSNEPLFTSLHGRTTPVLDIIPPPALHIKLGVVNKLYDELHKLFPGLDNWPTGLYITREDYHGHTFEGNECNKLLDNLDNLLEIIPQNLIAYYDCFVAFREAMHACLGFTLDPLYREKVDKFKEKYKTLNISVTSKVHIMFRHVPEFMDQHKKALGEFSEQVVESSHSKFDRFLDSYRIKDIFHANYSKQFYRAVMHFNSYHV